MDQIGPNFMSRWICCGVQGDAKQILVERYSQFGIMERFAESLALFHDVFGVSNRLETALNVSPPTPVFVKEGLVERFHDENAEDFELYAYADELFLRRLAEHGVPGRACEERQGVQEKRPQSYTPRMHAQGKSLLCKAEDTPNILLEVSREHEEKGDVLQAALCLRQLIYFDKYSVASAVKFLLRYGAKHDAEILARTASDYIAAYDGEYASFIQEVLESTQAAAANSWEGGAIFLDCFRPVCTRICVDDLVWHGHLEQALSLIDEVAESTPLISRAELQLARAAVRSAAREDEVALGLLADAFERDRSSLPVVLALVDTLFRLGKAADLLAVLDRSRLAEFLAPWVAMLRGEASCRLGRPDEAAAHFQEAAARAPDHLDMVLPWVVHLRVAGRLDEALDALGRLRDANRPHRRIDKELAVTLYVAGRTEDAWRLIGQGHAASGPSDAVDEHAVALSSLRGKSALFVVAAPVMAWEWMLKSASDTGLEAPTAAICFSDRACEVALEYGVGRCERAPAGRYLHEKHQGLISDDVASCGYDAIVLLTSGGDLREYREILSLVYALRAGARLVFTFDQMWQDPAGCRLRDLDHVLRVEALA